MKINEAEINKPWDDTKSQQFATVLVNITDVDFMLRFLRDVMTEKEIAEISARFEAARMLKAGEKYQEIAQKTKLSSRTIARISNWLKNGTGGYSEALALLHHDHIPPAHSE